MRAARTATTVLISAVLALGAASCGGSEVEYDEVPGAPADGASWPPVLGWGCSGAGVGVAVGAGEPPVSGAGVAVAEPDGPSNDTAPPPGSEAEQFEAFCAENPGAC